MELLSSHKSFGGETRFYKHASLVCQCNMRFSVFLPPAALEGQRVPAIYWLSGLTCNEQNFMQKAGAQRVAAQLGLAIIAPDTSPRGEGVPDAPDESYDLGLGAGFYLDAISEPWAKHYQMSTYVIEELPQLIHSNFPIDPDLIAISGHSMGGHGALTLGLKNPKMFRSISAFSPICAPSLGPWGQKAFSNYLGSDQSLWANYDATILIAQAQQKTPIRIDVGLKDEYLETELMIDNFLEAAKNNDYAVGYHAHEGYDHTYYFVSSFIEDQILFHAKYLQKEAVTQ